MRLFEFAGKDPIITKLVVLSDQLERAVNNGEIQGEWTTEQLLDFLSSNGVNVDEPDIFDMVKKPPLSGVISNINNDVVTFKGQEQPDLPTPDQNQSQQVVKQMAQSAMK
jgi:hypothetical protein